MNAMFHLPHGNGALLGGSPFEARRLRLLGTFRHTVTNRRITFEVWQAELSSSRIADAADDSIWLAPADLESVPHPSYVRKALRFVTTG